MKVKIFREVICNKCGLRFLIVVNKPKPYTNTIPLLKEWHKVMPHATKEAMFN